MPHFCNVKEVKKIKKDKPQNWTVTFSLAQDAADALSDFFEKSSVSKFGALLLPKWSLFHR